MASTVPSISIMRLTFFRDENANSPPFNFATGATPNILTEPPTPSTSASITPAPPLPPASTESIPEDLQILACPVCKEVPRNKIICCSNGHSVCFQCANQVNHCPVCRVEFGQKVRNLTLEQLVEDLRRQPPNGQRILYLPRPRKPSWKKRLSKKLKTLWLYTKRTVAIIIGVPLTVAAVGTVGVVLVVATTVVLGITAIVLVPVCICNPESVADIVAAVNTVAAATNNATTVNRS